MRAPARIESISPPCAVTFASTCRLLTISSLVKSKPNWLYLPGSEAMLPVAAFVEIGDMIEIDTRTNEFKRRAN